MIREIDPTRQSQTVDRYEIPALLKDVEGIVIVDAILINGILSEMDLKGHDLSDFDSLKDDVYTAIAFHIKDDQYFKQ